MIDETDGLSDALRPLLLYWVAARGGKLMPSRADIDPVTMPRRLLPNIVLVDVVPASFRFRYRVMGTAVSRMLGADWTGRYVDEVPELGEQLHAQYLDTVESGRPTLRFNERERFDDVLMQHRIVRSERLLLPLSNTDRTVFMVLGGHLEQSVVV